jgi:hypothetical protein
MSNRTRPIPGSANPKCYARALKGCCRQMSGENFLSKAILKRVNEEFTESSGVEGRNMGFQLPDTARSLSLA